MDREVSGVKIECVKGNIVQQPDMTAIVNAANAWLQMGGGVAGAIHHAAGRGLEEECALLAPIGPGDAVITSGHRLPNRFVIHCLGPVYGVDKPEDQILSDCYKNALRIADDNEIESIAFPAISTGAFGYPVQEAAMVALSTVIDYASNLKHVKTIRFVLFNNEIARIHEDVLSELLTE